MKNKISIVLFISIVGLITLFTFTHIRHWLLEILDNGGWCNYRAGGAWSYPTPTEPSVDPFEYGLGMFVYFVIVLIISRILTRAFSLLYSEKKTN